MRSTTSVAVLTAAALALYACGDNDGDSATTDSSAAAPTTASSTEPLATTNISTAAPRTTVPASTVLDLTVPPTTAPAATVPPAPSQDETWRNEADAYCAHWAPTVGLADPATDQASLVAYAQAHLDAWESAPDLSSIDLPPGPGRTPADFAAVVFGQKAAIDAAMAGAAAGDYAATTAATNVVRRHIGLAASAFAAAGESCGPADAAVAANAALNVSMLAPWQLETGYGSVWVSQDIRYRVARVDPENGAMIAAVEMPSPPIKLQPADGRMIVRTEDSYVAIDAETNTVVDRLLKADVGPNANRSWAVDGALWICDGPRLHHYDPATFEPIALVELDFECGQTHASADLAVAFSYNEDPGESGTSRAAFVNPAANSVMATVDLVADPTVPVVLDDAVFFPPVGGSQATVVDRSNWTVSAVDLGRPFEGGSQPAFDGANIYVIADKATSTIAVIDPVSFQVTGELRAIATAPSLNSLAATPGVVWAVNNSGGLLQRFDTVS